MLSVTNSGQLGLILVIFLSLQIQVGICNCASPCHVPLTVNVKCGSNGVTYQNEQELLCAKMHCEPTLYLAHNGDCQNLSSLRPSEQIPGKLKINQKNTSLSNKIKFVATKNQPKQKEQLFPSPLLPPPRSLPANPIQGFVKHVVSPCLETCVCEYFLSPVCASNRVTYGNRCVLECAQKCEPNLKFHHHGFCGKIFFNRKSFAKLTFFKLYAPESAVFI